MLLKRIIRNFIATSRRGKSSDEKPSKEISNTSDNKSSSDLEKSDKSNKLMKCIQECKLILQGNRPTYQPLKSVNVTVLHAFHPPNTELCLQLKLNPYVNEIRMHDTDTKLYGQQLDIQQINTSSKVLSFIGKHQLKRALHRANIVVVTATNEPNDVPNSAEVFHKNAEHIKQIAHQCVAYCPDAIFVITAYPINANVPLFAEIFLQNGVFCPNHIMGSMALKEMRTRTLAAISLGLDPAKVQVDVIGGGTPQSFVPVLSGARPGGAFLRDDYHKIYKKLKHMTREILKTKGRPPIHSAGYADSLLLSKITKGLCGKSHSRASVLLRTSALFGIKYLAVPVKFGLSGVEKNFGIPMLSANEIDTLDAALAELQNDISMGEEYAKPKDVKNRIPKTEDLEDEDDVCTSRPTCV